MTRLLQYAIRKLDRWRGWCHLIGHTWQWQPEANQPTCRQCGKPADQC